MSTLFPDVIFVRNDGRFVKVRVADILYIESRKNYCRLVFKDKVLLVLVRLKVMEAGLPSDAFLRIHRGIIVSVAWVTSFDYKFVYGPGDPLPIGEMYRTNLARRLTLVHDSKLKEGEIVL